MFIDEGERELATGLYGEERDMWSSMEKGEATMMSRGEESGGGRGFVRGTVSCREERWC